MMLHKEYTNDAIQWCRDNAPDACKDCSDDELWDLMKAVYYVQRNSSPVHEVSKGIMYKELLARMPADIVTFSCPYDCDFILSLERDGYTEGSLTHSRDYCSEWFKHTHSSTSAAPTAHAGWIIYHEGTDSHYSIELTNNGDGFDVVVERQQTKADIKLV